jgi:hypothetical protein
MRSMGCPHCGGPVDRADYVRKPRGLKCLEVKQAAKRRFSLCCRREGCRRRVRVTSLRFMSQKVYTFPTIIRCVLGRSEATAISMRRLRREHGASGVSIRRWTKQLVNFFTGPSWTVMSGALSAESVISLKGRELTALATHYSEHYPVAERLFRLCRSLAVLSFPPRDWALFVTNRGGGP